MNDTTHTPTDAVARLGTRICVVGTTGSGKSTLARTLAGIIGGTYIELDACNWDPDWTQTTPDVFQARVDTALEAAQGRWVADGNYYGRSTTWHHAETIVWLDYTIVRIYWQLLKRTVSRVARRTELWAGNKERLRTAFFSKESLFVWATQTHWRHRREYPRRFQQLPVRVYHLRSPAAMRAFLAGLRAPVR